ncbi:hypothetical protein WJX84_008634 [Apatococcus fuscideae]|uniref:Flavanone 4-reductase n=1 Tax=Apatococcus fuscideae TaxID=2026836 RepID=A0AAW1T499_9CHLO
MAPFSRATVCVTGGTGFVASELIKQLLEKAYTVKTTVRNPDDDEKLLHLKALAEGLPGSLSFHKADLLERGAFDSVVQGCTYIFHTASPFFIDSDDPQKALIDPAVKGTENVLQSAAKVSSVSRVVLTSSVAAVQGNFGAPPKNGKLYTEEDWNETSTIEKGQAYHLSKTLAEKAAWKLAKASKFELVTICPNFVLGPVMSRRSSGTSIGYMKGYLEGRGSLGSSANCDVRDVAKAHVLAAEIPSASGRYIISEPAPVPAAKQASEWLQAAFPSVKLSTGEDSKDTKELFDNSKAAKELGLNLTSPKSTLVDMAATMMALGIAKPTTKH